jgi:tyrosine-specific transport protein
LNPDLPGRNRKFYPLNYRPIKYIRKTKSLKPFYLLISIENKRSDKMSKVKTFAAISTLIGTIIGAGILGLPYIASLSGFYIALIHLVVVGSLVLLTALYIGEIGLRTKKNHQLPGYAELYLGKTGKKIMLLAFIFGIYSALLAYLIGESESLSTIFFNSSSYSLQFGILFWILISAITFHGIKSLEQGEKIGLSAIVILIISILILLWKNISIENLTYINLSNAFTPFGVVLFAYLGFAAIPEIERILNKHKEKTKSVILTSYISVFVIYSLFILIVLGSLGLGTTEIATLSLGKILILLGMVTMLTSYLALSIAMMDTLKFDYNLSHKKAWIATSLPPLIIFVILNIFSISSFSKVLGFGGALSGGLTAIIVLSMIKSAKQKGKRVPEYSMPFNPFIKWLLIIIFSLGAFTEIINLFY